MQRPVLGTPRFGVVGVQPFTEKEAAAGVCEIRAGVRVRVGHLYQTLHRHEHAMWQICGVHGTELVQSARWAPQASLTLPLHD